MLHKTSPISGGTLTFAVMKKVRVRFAPSPTGGLHLGGVRTALFNYLFARQHQGDFVLRVEDTDQTRYVEGAEQYIFQCLEWCGILPDEGPHKQGDYGPYRQSERKDLYRKYAQQLVASGHAYYAFDTPEEIEQMRADLKVAGKQQLLYGASNRLSMKNSLSLSPEETEQFKRTIPYVIRLKMPESTVVNFQDLIRGDLAMHTEAIDDKVLLKTDGMPTYHLAVVVDDYLMKITHAFRGEEWLPSAPVYVLIWKYLGWEREMPAWAHLPLILKPDGNGKLSKRDGERLGFPVFAIEWDDPNSGLQKGFKEMGFLPEAFVNMLAMLGWNDGTEREIFSLSDLEKEFSLERVHVHGAKFDFEKAKWFNHEWIKLSSAGRLLPEVRRVLQNSGVEAEDEEKLLEIIGLVKERCILLTDFLQQSAYFFQTPNYDQLDAAELKWNADKDQFFRKLIAVWEQLEIWHHDALENAFKDLATETGLKGGAVMAPLRMMLVGGKFGPGVFDIAFYLKKEKTLQRIRMALEKLRS